MSRGEKRIFFLVLAVLGVALSIILAQSLTGADGGRIYRVTVLTDGSDEDYWSSFRKGVEQAARESNVDVRFVSRYESDPGAGQITALRQAWEGDADGVVVIPLDGEALAQALMDAPPQFAVTVAGLDMVAGPGVSCVTADNRAMGARLAQAVADSGGDGCVVFLPTQPQTAVAERYEGFAVQAEILGLAVEQGTAGDAIPPEVALVALEPAGTEGLCRQPEPVAGRVFGVGASSQLLRYLEDGVAAALVAQSDYAAGYLSLGRVAGAITGQTAADAALDCYTVTKENLFSEPLVQILYPIS